MCKKLFFPIQTLRGKCPNTELFPVRIFCIRTEYRDLLRKSPYLSEYSKIRTRNSSVFGQFPRSESCCKDHTYSLLKFVFSTQYSTSYLNIQVTHLKSDSHLPIENFFICFNDSPSRMMKNVFYLILKALFVFKIFKFLH